MPKSTRRGGSNIRANPPEEVIEKAPAKEAVKTEAVDPPKIKTAK